MAIKARFALALLALAFTALSAAPPTAPKTYMEVCGVDSFTSDGLSFIAIAFAIVSFSIGLAYMYSKLREDAHLGVWAKDEAFNLVISLLLFVGVLVFFTASCSIAQSYSGGSPITASQQYLDGLISSNGLNVLRTLTSDSIDNQLDATKYLYTGLTPFWGDGVAMRGNRKAHSAHREYLIDLYLPIVASLNAQKYVLQGIAWMGASVLLPFAFVLRLIPFSREFGNMLLALFFGLYIVVPTIYAVSGQVFAQNIANVPTPYTTDPTLQKFHSYGLDNSIFPLPNIKDSTFYRIGSTIPQAIFLPNIAIVVAVSCIMAMAKALRAIAV
ncbi:MAG: hypothetical protein WC717_03685 [Candidatus Micrarchaeia archaeon]|jgi:hypothetical protein